jgi:RNA polymerase sigma-70 factor (ECF subfamily)
MSLPPTAPLDGSTAAPSRVTAASGTDSFEQAIADHHLALRRLVFRLLGWSGEADDLLQEVYLKAWRNWQKFRGDSEVRTWLTRIAINQCRSHHRRKQLGLGLLEKLWRGSSPPVEPPASHAATRHELAAQVRHAVQQLRPRDREVVVLYYLEETPVAQMAQLLNTTRPAIEVRLSRARKRLRDLMTNV